MLVSCQVSIAEPATQPVKVRNVVAETDEVGK